MGTLPKTIVEAIEAGKAISEEQLLEVIEAEAKALSLSRDQAISAAREGRLPKGNRFASDIEFLVELLPATTAA